MSNGVLYRTLSVPLDTGYFTSLNIHKVRARRNDKRLPSSDLIGRAKSTVPPFTLCRKRASD